MSSTIFCMSSIYPDLLLVTCQAYAPVHIKALQVGAFVEVTVVKVHGMAWNEQIEANMQVVGSAPTADSSDPFSPSGVR